MNNIVPDELFLTIIANEVIDLCQNLYTYYMMLYNIHYNNMYSLRTRMSHRIKRIIIFYRTQKIVSYRHRINIINYEFIA